MKKTDEDKKYDLLLANVRAVLATTQGKELLWEIMSMCGIYNNTFTGNSSTFFAEGKRAIGLEILGLLSDADPTAYARMQLERSKEV